jgi:hypothetical protein
MYSPIGVLFAEHRTVQSAGKARAPSPASRDASMHHRHGDALTGVAGPSFENREVVFQVLGLGANLG